MALNYQAAVNITATYDGKGVNQASNDFKKFDGTLKGTLGGLKSLKAGFAGLVAAFAVKEIAQFAKSVIDLGDNLSDLKKKTGVGVQTLSDLKGAAERNGLSFEQFESSLKKFTVTLTKAQAGSKEAAAGFKAIGLSAADFKSADQAIFAIAEKFKNAEDGAAKAAVAVALFGKTGADLIPLLNQGKEGIKGMGAQMSEEFTKQADTFNDKLVQMKNGVISFSASILEKVLPAVNKFMDVLIGMGSAIVNGPKSWKEMGLVQGYAGNSRGQLTDLRRLDDQLMSQAKGAAGKTKIDTSFLGGEDQTNKLESEAKSLQKYRDELAQLASGNGLQKQFASDLSMTTAEFEKIKIATDETTKAQQATAGWTAANRAEYMKLTETIIEQKQAMIDYNEQQKQTFGAGARSAMKEYIENAKDTAAQTKSLFSAAFTGLEDAIVSFVKTGKLSFADLANTISEMLLRIAIQKAIAVGISTAFGGAAFANGGIMTANGPVPLNKYASGGIARSPQLALFGEGSQAEAYVPLPDGRSIPVSMKGGGGSGTSVTVNVNIASDGSASKDEASDTEKGKQLGNMMATMITQELIKQKRPGGLLA